jgi:phosphohistidine phosphatase
MAIYLVQHGRANPAEPDAERGLTDEGRAEVEHIAEVARGYRVKVSAIIQSGKKRALQTAEVFAEKLGPGIVITESPGMGPMDDVASFAGRIDAGGNRMYVGHLPFMEKLASHLITGSTERPVFKFQNGGIVCLEIHPDTGTWVIRWALMPKIG